MLRRFGLLVFAFMIVALALYVVVLNREAVTLNLAPGTSINTSSGIGLIVVFCLGVLLTALIALFFGFKSWIRERSFLQRQKQHTDFLKVFERAREHTAIGEHAQAIKIWQQIIKQEPKSVAARIELSRSLQALGDLPEAARSVDAARTLAPNNLEVLFRAAELNLAVGNKTAAVDNLALVLYNQPVKQAAELARDLSADLGRFEDALMYQAQFEKLVGSSEADQDALARIKLSQIQKEKGSDPAIYESALKSLLKEHKNFPPALQALAKIRLLAKDRSGASKLLVQAALQEPNVQNWRAAFDVWLSADQPEQALELARSATRQLHGFARLQLELETVALLLKLQLLEEARERLNNLAALFESEQVTSTPELAQRVLILKALYFKASGNQTDLEATLQKLFKRELAAPCAQIADSSTGKPLGESPLGVSRSASCC